jgi:hypothetical protein
MLNGLNKSEITKKATEDNIYQVDTETRSKNIASTTYNRMSVYSKDLLEEFIKTDITTSKVMVLISIMATDKLFYEYMNEIYKEHKILDNKQLTKKELDKFIEQKKIENEKISQWSDGVIRRMKSTYIKILKEAGLIDQDNNIKSVYIDYDVEKLLRKTKFENFLDIII